MRIRGLGKTVRRITILGTDGEKPKRIRVGKRKKKKTSRAWKPGEKMMRRLIKANKTFANVYLERHDKSRRKKKDGWVRDFTYNLSRATRKANKKLKLPRSLWWVY
jgi:hypothetical protein